MNTAAAHTANAYRKLDVQTSVAEASSHQLIDMLFEGARDRIHQALGYLERGDMAAKSQAINAVVDIVEGLQASLDHEQGGELAGNLEALYDYMQRRLFRANSDNDTDALREVGDLIATLRSAWVAIDPQE